MFLLGAAAFFIVSTCIGVFDGIAERSGALFGAVFAVSPRGLLSGITRTTSGIAAMRWVMVFAYGHSVHCLIRLRLIPEMARSRTTPRTFTQTVHELHGEVGVVPLVVMVCGTLALRALACADQGEARTVYIRLASFHGCLEVMVLCFWPCLPRLCTPCFKKGFQHHEQPRVFSGWLAAFVVTQLMEMPLYFLLFRRHRRLEAFVFAFTPSALTHPPPRAVTFLINAASCAVGVILF